MATSPAGCYGQTDYPHPSTHYPTTVNVIARTKCNYGVSLYIKVKLWRHRWWGWEELNWSADSGWGSSISENTFKDCSGTYTYRGTARHESYESSGTYIANTESGHSRIKENSSTYKCEWA